MISPKEHYQRLRLRSCAQLWDEDVPAFERASARDRVKTVAIIRAVGVVFAESGSEEQRAQAREWLRGLLRDPEEKVRRYAMTALPKVGADHREESELLGLIDHAASEREKQSVGRALEKIGGAATLAKAAEAGPSLPERSVQKAAGNLARRQEPGAIRLDAVHSGDAALRIHLRCRRGLEGLLAAEVRDHPARSNPFAVQRSLPGLVVVIVTAPFTLADLFRLRCFGTTGFFLGTVKRSAADAIGDMARVITSPAARRLLSTFTDGPIRYRLELPGRGHQRGPIRNLGDRIFARCPDLINDSRGAPWQIDVHPTAAGHSLELTPRFRPDPRFAYRRRDVPAASHPPLAAAMARLAGDLSGATVWDPFCGSGSELIECALRGGVRRAIGTDLSPEAITIAEENLAAAANVPAVESAFTAADFRDHARIPGLGAGQVSVVVTNPPLGRRVPIPNLRGLISDLLSVASFVLCPGGRLVFVNPFSEEFSAPSLRRDFRQKIDLGGFNGHLERYVKPLRPRSLPKK